MHWLISLSFLSIAFLLFYLLFFCEQASKQRSIVPVDQKESMGQGTWAYLNIHVAQIPNGIMTTEQKAQTIVLLETILQNYPCIVCRAHAQQYLETHSLQNILQTAEDAREWVFNFHQDVNNKLKKPIYTYQQFINDWLEPYHNCSGCQEEK